MTNVSYCNHCGSANPIGSKFCSQCGTSMVLNTIRKLESPQPQIQDTEACCPVCKHDDKTAKVSAIVASQTTTGNSLGYNYNTDSLYSTSSNSKTSLAAVLSKPTPPFYSTELGKTFIKMYGIALYAVIAFGVLVLASGGTSGGGCGLSIIIAGGIGLFFYYSEKKSPEEIKAETKSWVEAESRWQLAYYCFRCDKIFIRYNEKKWQVSPSGFKELLFRPFRDY